MIRHWQADKLQPKFRGEWKVLNEDHPNAWRVQCTETGMERVINAEHLKLWKTKEQALENKEELERSDFVLGYLKTAEETEDVDAEAYIQFVPMCDLTACPADAEVSDLGCSHDKAETHHVSVEQVDGPAPPSYVVDAPVSDRSTLPVAMDAKLDDAQTVDNDLSLLGLPALDSVDADENGFEFYEDLHAKTVAENIAAMAAEAAEVEAQVQVNAPTPVMLKEIAQATKLSNAQAQAYLPDVLVEKLGKIDIAQLLKNSSMPSRIPRPASLSPKAAQVPKSGDSSVNSSVNIVSPTSNALNVPAVPATVADKATCKSRTLSAHAQSARGTATGQPVPASTAAYGTPRVRAQTKRYGTLESDFKVAQAKVTKPVVKSTTRPKLARK